MFITFSSIETSHVSFLESHFLCLSQAMIGFFMAYFVDGLTGMGLVDQIGNSFCKACLLTVVVGIILFCLTQDFGNMRRLINEFTLYDKQWQATRKDGNANTPLQQDQARSRTK